MKVEHSVPSVQVEGEVNQAGPVEINPGVTDQTRLPQMPERKEDQYLGHALTPEGWKELRWRGGKEVEIDPIDTADMALKPIHKKFRERHRQSLMMFMECVDQVKSVNRKIPILREEAIEKVKLDKQVIKDLIGFGLLETHTIPIDRAGKKMGGRAVLFPSLEARKLKRAIEAALSEVIQKEEGIHGEREVTREPGVVEATGGVGSPVVENEVGTQPAQA